ncbi:DUF58 domain-containing protein [Zoogloea sp.]|uniref:DUF58 domain-containing protein n=1 Tax=Zoogloea sp. TaxID=49181 RepID=UPI00261E2731|nr:DUF58 domain-containing protein [Zoogloea sp.]MDD3354363.1 DUF58 domain-containing protein [Zoogloea sp.]
MRAARSPRRILERWLFRVGDPEPSPVQLGQRRIFVLPTSFGLALGASLLVMLLASINYNLSLGFALTFLIAGTAWVSIHHAFRTLIHLGVRAGRSPAVFLGEAAVFSVILDNPADRHRRGLQLWPTGSPSPEETFDLSPDTTQVIKITVATHSRGWLQLPRLTLESRYPLGLIRAWSLFQPELRCLVYPALEQHSPSLPFGDGPRPGDRGRQGGTDDFAGLRHHQPADSPRHIAWKAVARGAPWQTKEFEGHSARVIWLDWNTLPPSMDVETRLSRLARWVVEAERAGVDYGLRLPGSSHPPGQGEPHRHACLKMLALHGSPGHD